MRIIKIYVLVFLRIESFFNRIGSFFNDYCHSTIADELLQVYFIAFCTIMEIL